MESDRVGRGESLRSRLRKKIYAVFSDDLMVLLALLLIPATLLPLIFTFSSFTITVFLAVNYFVIAMFVAEYVLKLWAADDRRRFFLNPWHLLDLVIVILALLDFVPDIPGGGRFAPLLRLIRLSRLFAVAGRTVGRAAPARRRAPPAPPQSRLRVTLIDESLKAVPSRREDLASLAQRTAPSWIDLQEVSALDLDAICSALQIPGFELQSKVLKETFPQIDYYPRFTSILVKDSRLVTAGGGVRDLVIRRGNFLIICSGKLIVTLSAGDSDLLPRLTETRLQPEGEGFSLKVLVSILALKNRDYEDILDAIEQETIMLEEEPAGKLKQSFLDETFSLKRMITDINNILRHSCQVLVELRERAVALDCAGSEQLVLFKKLSDESAYLYEISDNTRERIVSLIDLSINTVSLNMNRVMRMLAVITCLGLIPSIAGGLLGMNLTGNPWRASIYEVSLLLLMAMLVAFYLFWKKRLDQIAPVAGGWEDRPGPY
ncbi:MAG: CorA family divalent cation transporter [PVC group bacterium]